MIENRENSKPSIKLAIMTKKNDYQSNLANPAKN